MALISILTNLLVFFGLVFGLGLPFVVATRLEVVEKLALGAAAGVFLIYGAAWLVYWTGLPQAAFFALPVLALLATASRWRLLKDFLGGSEAQRLLGRQLLFTAWCTGWLALTRSYGGGEWSADWEEHYQRTRFFLERQPWGTMFLHLYSLPARPPLANLVDGAFMAISGTDFAHFQFFNTLGSTLLLLPAMQLARHFARGSRGDAVLLLMLMLNPLVLQNATFAWTKLLAAFFVLLAVAFHVRGLADIVPLRRNLAVGAIAVALLTHYSAGPYALGLAMAQVVFVWTHRRDPAKWRELLAQGAVAAALLATWFAWSMFRYGAHTTFFSNTTATGDAGLSLAEWVDCRVWNIFVTLVPHALRPADYSFIAQASSLGYARDYLFNIYQTTLPGAFGAAGLVLLGWSVWRRPAPTAGAERRFWRWFPVAMILLGIATAAWRDRWGIVHICLPALIICGVAWLAAHWDEVPAAVRRLWIAALGLDLALGIALHFYLQATVRLTPGSLTDLSQGRLLEYSQSTSRNMLLKLLSRYNFVADGGLSPVLVAALLAMFLALAIRQVAFSRATIPPNSPR